MKRLVAAQTVQIKEPLNKPEVLVLFYHLSIHA
jgi:hypothetical protein